MIKRVTAPTYLTSIVGRRLVLDGILVTVTAVRATTAVVTVQEAPAAAQERVEVPVDWVQNAIDWLYEGREVPRAVEADGWAVRTAFLLLELLPGVEVAPGGGLVLPERLAWDLAPGDSITGDELLTRFGGHSNTRISVSPTSGNVFILGGAGKDKATRWQGDVLHIPGNKIRRSDLSEASSTVLEHLEDGLALRVFWRRGSALVYAGEFTVDPYPTHYISETRGGDGHLHKRIVFRLRPVGAFVRGPDEGVEGGRGDEAMTPFANLPQQQQAVAPRQQQVGAGNVVELPVRKATPERQAAEPLHAARLHAGQLHAPDTTAAEDGRTAALTDSARATVRAARTNAGPVLLARGPWPPVLLGSVLAVALTSWVWTSSPLRAAVTIWFLLVCPGMALVRLLPLRDTLLRIVLAVAASLAVETLLAEAAVLAHLWSPGALLLLLLAITTGAVAVDLGEARPDVAGAVRLRVLPRPANEAGGT